MNNVNLTGRITKDPEPAPTPAADDELAAATDFDELPFPV